MSHLYEQIYAALEDYGVDYEDQPTGEHLEVIIDVVWQHFLWCGGKDAAV